MSFETKERPTVGKPKKAYRPHRLLFVVCPIREGGGVGTPWGRTNKVKTSPSRIFRITGVNKRKEGINSGVGKISWEVHFCPTFDAKFLAHLQLHLYISSFHHDSIKFSGDMFT